ncbi:antitoxin Xre-like helix-turn-helix domain-containing protein [Fibrella rubiginis]|uniref:antitoxin Xre-like helix-turn-helix domain-containing protein n=1 Tax=Fibrella rubiginis TaxID=2817060 RepID=UPI001E656E49|nr:antitoxin Xre-like helix-turn-helix domain-containing protein [Fibrella rubiginis]
MHTPVYTTPPLTATAMPVSNRLSAPQLIDRSRQGLVGTEAGQIARLLAITDKEMTRLLNQSVATFHRQAKAVRLDAATSERLLLLSQLATYGASVFQD